MMLAILAPLAPQSPVPDPRDVQTLQVVLLLKGRSFTADRTPEVQALQLSHAAHLSALGAAGHLLASGPVSGDGDVRGVLLLRAADLSAAATLVADDPAVKAERLRPEIESLQVAGNWFSLGRAVRDAPVRQFIVAVLSSGPEAAGQAGQVADAQSAHLAHLWKLREAGVLVLAGTFEGAGRRRALAVFASDNLAAVRALVNEDPAVKAGRLTVDLLTWLGPDGVMTIAKTGS